MSFLQTEGFYVFLGACWFLVLCQSGIRSCRRESDENAIDDNDQDSPDGLTLEERKQAARQDRRLKILTTLLHKVSAQCVFRLLVEKNTLYYLCICFLVQLSLT